MFNIPPVTKNIIIINLLMFLGKLVAVRYGIDFDDLLGLHFFKASDFRLYQFFTYMFVHAGWEHIFFNMFAVWMFGRVMEQVMGSQKFLFYYIVCGVGAGLMQEGAQWIEFAYQGLASYDTVNVGGMVMPMSAYLNDWTTVGASGAVYGILLSFGMTFPNERLFIIPIPVPIKLNGSLWVTPSSNCLALWAIVATTLLTWLTSVVCSSACCSSYTGATRATATVVSSAVDSAI